MHDIRAPYAKDKLLNTNETRTFFRDRFCNISRCYTELKKFVRT